MLYVVRNKSKSKLHVYIDNYYKELPVGDTYVTFREYESILFKYLHWFDYIDLFVRNYLTRLVRREDLDLSNTDWNNVVWTSKDPSNTPGFGVFQDGVDYEIETQFKGVLRFTGLVQPHFNGDSQAAVKVMSRLLMNNSEIEGSQCSIYRDFRSGEIATLPFDGRISVKEGDKVKLQVKSDNSNTDLLADTDFDKPVSATITLDGVTF